MTYIVTAHQSDSPKMKGTAPIHRTVILTSNIAKEEVSNMANSVRIGNDETPSSWRGRDPIQTTEASAQLLAD